MKIILELTGQEYHLIHEAVGAALQEAKEDRAKYTLSERNSVAYQNADFKVKKLAKMYSGL